MASLHTLCNGQPTKGASGEDRSTSLWSWFGGLLEDERGGDEFGGIVGDVVPRMADVSSHLSIEGLGVRNVHAAIRRTIQMVGRRRFRRGMKPTIV